MSNAVGDPSWQSEPVRMGGAGVLGCCGVPWLMAGLRMVVVDSRGCRVCVVAIVALPQC